MYHRLFCFCLSALLLVSCAAREEQPPVQVTHDIGVDEELLEPLDEELTEAWPTVGDVELSEAERTALETRLEFPYPLDEYAAERIQEQFLFLTRRVPRTIRKWVARSEPYLPYIVSEIEEAGLPKELAYLPYIESGFNPRAYSSAGAAGMWQFMAATGRKFGLRRDMWVDERRDPYKSTLAAAAYLTRLYELLGEWTLAVASYNAGEAKIMKAAEATGSSNFFELAQRNHTLPHSMRLREETLNFVPRLLAMSKIVENLETLGYREPDSDNALKVARIRIGPRVNLKALARACGMSWKEFRTYNPAFRRSATPPQGEFWASVPVHQEAAALDYLAKPQPKPDYEGLTTYVVRSGDSWSRIASRHGISVRLIKEANNTSSNLLRPGQTVYVPIPEGDSVEEDAPVRSVKASSGSYVVRRGETLSHIAERTGVPVKRLMAANGLRSARALRAGQKLMIPEAGGQEHSRTESGDEPTMYKVQNGDTIWQVARRFKVKPDDLLRWNSLNKRSVIRPGDVLKVYVR